MTTRFRDDFRSVDSFSDEFLVHCPECRHCANVLTAGDVRFVCTHCGKLEMWKGSPGVLTSKHPPKRDSSGRRMAWIGAEYDWFFHYPLWLQTPCCGQTLWAYNSRHLAYLEKYVAAELRERRPNEYGWRNSSYASRLPQWLKAAKNRTAVLRACQKLHTLLATLENPPHS